MKKVVLIFALLAIASLTVSAQNSEIPTSKIIDSKSLLHDIEVLSADDMEGRKVGTPGGIKAREYVLRRFKEIGLETIGGNNLQPFIYTDRAKKEFQGANVFGYLKGKKYPDKYIVVSAHYDHLGVRNGEVFNGADDDASGTSALFTLAAYFKKHQSENSLIFVAFDAEESGLLGSKKFVAEPPVKLENIVINVSLDMISHNDRNELYGSGT